MCRNHGIDGAKGVAAGGVFIGADVAVVGHVTSADASGCVVFVVVGVCLVNRQARPAPPVLHGEAWVRLTPVIDCSTNLMEWRSVAGVPTWFCATNQMEFFTTRRLLIERAALADGK